MSLHVAIDVCKNCSFVHLFILMSAWSLRCASFHALLLLASWMLMCCTAGVQKIWTIFARHGVVAVRQPTGARCRC